MRWKDTAVLMLMSFALVLAAGPAKAADITAVRFTHANVTGIGHEPGVTRRDPSDIIKVGDTYYIYYTKVVKAQLSERDRHLYPSGYPGTVWFATSTDAGHTWTEQGEALGLGAAGQFDDFGVFTPNILFHEGRYWLYYDAVQAPFINTGLEHPTAIGLAVSDSPAGPFVRIKNNPILRPGTPASKFDSYRVDDTCLLVRDGRIWMYYKGRCLEHGETGPRHTQMGVAIADAPIGPYVKANGGDPVQDSGHEVQIWKSRPGVYSLVASNVGPNGWTLQYATDGLAFKVVCKLTGGQPGAPGLYRPELTDPAAEPGDELWGISHGNRSGDVHLRRFTMKLQR